MSIMAGTNFLSYMTLLPQDFKKEVSMRIHLLLSFILFVFFSKNIVRAEVPPVANTCIGCHGPSGISTSPTWPNLAGQKEAYLIKALKDFKNGNRKDPLMSPMVTALSEADILTVAKYFSSLNSTPQNDQPTATSR